MKKITKLQKKQIETICNMTITESEKLKDKFADVIATKNKGMIMKNIC